MQRSALKYDWGEKYIVDWNAILELCHECNRIIYCLSYCNNNDERVQNDIVMCNFKCITHLFLIIENNYESSFFNTSFFRLNIKNNGERGKKKGGKIARK